MNMRVAVIETALRVQACKHSPCCDVEGHCVCSSSASYNNGESESKASNKKEDTGSFLPAFNLELCWYGVGLHCVLQLPVRVNLGSSQG